MTDIVPTEKQLNALESLAESSDFESVHSGLTDVVRLLETSGIGLNHSIRAYEIGRKLSNRCQELLDAAELRITQLDPDDVAG
jgi:exodeoxyribonuclease VII small subunit